MSNNILDKKIPSLAGLSILMVGLIATTYLVKGPSTFQIRADIASEPKNIQITNITDTTFTVIYTTDDKTIGTLTYGETPDNLDKLSLDERDQLSQKVNEYQVHSITVNSLTPSKNYYFKILSDNKIFENNNEAFSVKTGPTINNSPTKHVPIAGKIKNPLGKITNDGLVIVDINGAQKISGLINENGDYLVPLNNLRSYELSSYFVLNEDLKLNLNIIFDNLTSKIQLSKNQISPVPIITLSNNYDFSVSKKNVKDLKENEVKFPEFKSEIRKPSISPTPKQFQGL